MDLIIEVKVQQGFTVDTGIDKHAPGDIFSCDPWEANRLLDGGIVLLVNREGENEMWYPSPEEIEDAEKECMVASQNTVLVIEDPIALAISGLDPNKKNKTIWTRSGVPQTKVLTELMGIPVSAADRDIAYASHLAMQHHGCGK